MEIRIRNTGEVMTDITFRNTFRDRVIPTELTPEWLDGFAGGCDVVLEGPQPTTENRYQSCVRQGVEQIDGQWFTKYTLIEADDEGKAAMDAQQATNVRNTRNQKLAESDWTQLADSTADKQAWATYRQALRDVPTQAGFPWEVVWPDQP